MKSKLLIVVVIVAVVLTGFVAKSRILSPEGIELIVVNDTSTTMKDIELQYTYTHQIETIS